MSTKIRMYPLISTSAGKTVEINHYIIENCSIKPDSTIHSAGKKKNKKIKNSTKRKQATNADQRSDFA